MTKLKIKDHEKIQSRIALQGDTLKSFSVKVDVTNQYLSTVIRGKSNPSPLLAKRIAENLNLSINDIFFADNG
ncbi:helix-turn-helix transcriptional regulator [Psychrobacillus antarcticus]|uniref:helix-turn-helix transcriptional regulator n=1 Tax=Psychrobacillus antarcticus TaxID=2879115 RepID=UPI002407CAEC|nr:helix-turn-helix transcriptional regulator [Psychrobacillus antarcticus]